VDQADEARQIFDPRQRLAIRPDRDQRGFDLRPGPERRRRQNRQQLDAAQALRHDGHRAVGFRTGGGRQPVAHLALYCAGQAFESRLNL